MPPFSRLELWDEEPRNSLCFASGPIIIGAGPSGLAVAACLRMFKIPSLILEREDCIASLWKYNTYDRIHLHIPKQYCDLPFRPIPKHYPTYLSGAQFLDYLNDYASWFNIKPRFNERVMSAKFDERSQLWRVLTMGTSKANREEVREYVGHWLIVASGENAEEVKPNIENIHNFKGKICHSRSYKNGRDYAGKKVCVVGCGNSGMEIALDLLKSNAIPSIVVRNKVHVLPQEILGKATFAVIQGLLRIAPLWLADRILLFCAWCKWKNTAKWGLPRPKEGPIAYKIHTRRTPVLDIGTLCLVKDGSIEVHPAIESFTSHGANFCDGHYKEYDAIILATGYRSNVKDWLIGEDDQFDSHGLPKSLPVDGLKGKNGIYVVGMSGRGLLGSKLEAQQIAQHIKTQFGY
ncbi:hypothetical protein GOP47_0019079 [Adiantum capillus-veneris]|uniref:Flavin-containing monooxygenase n=1 Tax=Adiantum capillus-veneris TaxID=13818 RepID=A0A9D4UEK8_ADICA|nr:hypothetical protein GOP47_0019079 [Adiantum capillus-veneris]